MTQGEQQSTERAALGRGRHRARMGLVYYFCFGTPVPFEMQLSCLARSIARPLTVIDWQPSTTLCVALEPSDNIRVLTAVHSFHCMMWLPHISAGAMHCVTDSSSSPHHPICMRNLLMCTCAPL